MIEDDCQSEPRNLLKAVRRTSNRLQEPRRMKMGVTLRRICYPKSVSFLFCLVSFDFTFCSYSDRSGNHTCATRFCFFHTWIICLQNSSIRPSQPSHPSSGQSPHPQPPNSHGQMMSGQVSIVLCRFLSLTIFLFSLLPLVFFC